LTDGLTRPIESSLAEADWLRHGPVARLLAVLDRDGEEARVVGGAVRNGLLGLAPGDIDVATTSVPAETERRALAAGFHVVPTGVEHGTVTVIVNGTPFEVTTLREDVETFGRHARVRFGRDWRADALRRDFTINGMSADRAGRVYDDVGGRDDLAARRVRFIGEPAARIAEDYLRILRFFRFHASYGAGAPDAEAVRACIAARSGLDLLSRERVRAELLKLLVAPGAVDTVAVMAEAGLLSRVLAGVPLVASFARMCRIEREQQREPDAIRRLAALAVLVEEDAARLRERLRLSNSESERLVSMARWRVVRTATDESSARIMLYREGADRFVDRVLLAWARAGDDDAARWSALAGLPARWPIPVFPLRAADLMRHGVEKGPRLGAALRAAEEEWLAAGCPDDPAQLEAIAVAAARVERQQGR